MGPRSRTLLAIATSTCVLFFLSLLAGCGGGSQSSSSGSGSSGSGSGSTGSPSGGSGSSGSGSSGSGGSGSGGSGGSGSTAVAYVYNASTSAILGYAVSSNGTLTPVPNSPYNASTDTYIVTNGASVFSVDHAGQTLNTYSLNKSNGALTLANSTNAIQGNPNPADIVGSLALDHTGATLYIGEYDSSGDDGFGIFNVTGAAPQFITYYGNSEQYGPPLVFSPDDQYAYTANCYHASWTIFGYRRASDGTLTSVDPGSGADQPPFPPNNMLCPVTTAISAHGFLAVSYSELNGNNGSYFVAIYKINSDGSLTLVPNSEVTTASDTNTEGSLGLSFDPTGTYLAVAGDAGVQTYAISSAGLLSPVASPQTGGIFFESVAWDKSNHLYANSSTQLYVYNVNNGQLSPATGSPYAGGTGMTVLPLQ